MDKAELIKVITQKVVQKLKESQDLIALDLTKSSKRTKKVLILINHVDKNKDLIAQLEELEELKEDLCFVFHFLNLSEKEKYFDSYTVLSELPETEEFIQKFNLIFIDQLTISQLSRLANLQADTSPEKIIQKSILLKKPVAVAIDKIKTLLPIASQLPNVLRDKIQSYLNTLASLGIDLIGIKEFKRIIEQKLIKKAIFNYPHRPVVTKDDIILAYQSGCKKIELPKGAIITSLARDEAKRYEIEIVE